MELEQICRHANQINEENLQKLLRDNRNTEFGRTHEFAAMQDISQYQKCVPVSEYAAFGTDIARMQAGEKQVLTDYSVETFVKTSGSAGVQKVVPVTTEALSRYADYIERYKQQVSEQYPGKRLFLNTFRTDLRKEMAQTLLFSETYYRYLAQSEQLKEEDYVGGFELLFYSGAGNSWYVKAWLALLTEDITILESIFLYDQLIFFQYLEKHWMELLEDIRTGCIPSERNVEPVIQKALLSIPVNTARMQFLEEQCRQGFEAIALRLWPNLAIVSGIANPAYKTEYSGIRRYISNVPIHYFSYVASECLMGVAITQEDNQFVLLPKSAFYEFLPYQEELTSANPDAEKQEHRTVLPKDLKIGKLYEVVLTNFSGLYRYRLGDVVRITGYYFESPMVEFVFRKNQILNIAGEKMQTHQVDRAISSLNEQISCTITKYSAAIEEHTIPGRYLVVCALQEGEQYDGEEDVSQLLDCELMRINCDYADLRTQDYIEAPDVLLLEPEAFDSFLQENGYGKGHNKPQNIVLQGFDTLLWNQWKKENGKVKEK